MTEASPASVAHVRDAWWREHVATLSDLVRIPSVSPAFDADWADRGALRAVVDAVADWCETRTALPGIVAHRLELAGRSPLLIVDIPAHDPRGVGALATVLAYGHLDVQPAGEGWTVTEPYVPVLRGSLLYGRGTGDDKYVPVAVVAALEALRADGRAHPRVVILLETSEESSSVDLPAHLAAHGHLLGEPELVVCLDTFVPDGTRLWHSGSMRGIVVADLSVAVAAEGLHSGLVGGIAPSSFRILRELLDRIEDPATGACLVPELQASIPDHHREALRSQAALTGELSASLPLLPGVRSQAEGAVEQLLAQSWSPTIAYVGIDGMPPTGAAGSVLRASTTVRLSIRLPPTVPAADAAHALRARLETDPPSGARVSFDVVGAQDGWAGVAPADVLDQLGDAAAVGFGSAASECGGGATIPPLAMLAERWPDAPVLPLGIVTPASHPHGPDENIDVNAAVSLSVALAELLAARGAASE